VSNEDSLVTMLSYEEDSFTAIFVIASVTFLSLYLLNDIYRIINRIFMKTEDIAMLANRGGAKFSLSSLSEKDINIASAHEAGHVMAIHCLSDLINNVSVSIGQNASSLGRVRYSYVKPEKLYQKDVVEGEMLVALSGAVAEEMVFNTATTGSVSDMRRWESYARDYLINYSDDYFYTTPTTDKEIEHNNLLLTNLRKQQKEAILNYLKNNIDVYQEMYGEIKEKHSMDYDRIKMYFERISTPLPKQLNQ
jgi:ATP-dependent Zn protease